MSTPARLRPGQVLEAAGYVRVSTKIQGEGFSPEVQREAIKKLAAEQGYALTLIEEDHERGSNVTRAGYQRILEAVRQGTVHAVICFMFDRWGRDGAEWLTRARELDRLHVPIISVQEGRDEAGLLRFIRAGMAEEESRKIARRTRPAKENAVRAGIPMGTAGVGYKKVYPPHEGRGRRPPPILVPDEARAWVVRDLYRRYAEGGWSCKGLAEWLNTDPRCGLSPRGRAWSANHVKEILHSPLYKGATRYNRQPRGIYERAAPGSLFVVENTHEPLVSLDLWTTVQERMNAARVRPTHNTITTRSGRRVSLGSGLLRCNGCGASMFFAHSETRCSLYICRGRNEGWGACTERSYKVEIGNAALLAAVRRLRGAPWTPHAERLLLGGDGSQSAETAAATVRALEAERERLRRHTRLMSLMEEAPTPEQITTFREVSAEISARIRALESQLSGPTERAVQMPRLREVHATLTRTEIAGLVDTLTLQDDQTTLRTLVLTLVQSARLVERHPDSHPIWARMEVTWTPDIQLLLDAGALTLAPPPEGPALPTKAQMHAARQRRWRAHAKEVQGGHDAADV